jgi:predicted nuclease of predicted toxin-antitoxin system
LRLLFDQNLSPRLPDRLADLFPGSTHVSFLGLEQASDDAVRTYANVHSYAIVTKDADFGDIGVVRGFPPKVIWLRLGNCTTRDIEHCLRHNEPAIVSMGGDPNVGILTLYQVAHSSDG